jgi:DUF2975 family protein
MISDESGKRYRPAQPLGGAVRVIWGLILGLVALTIVFGAAVNHGSWSFAGFSHIPICVTPRGFGIGSSDWTLNNDPQFVASHGVTTSVAGTVQACSMHPSLGQRTLATFMSLPGTLVWLGVLFLLWRLVRTAEVYGPFTMRMAGLLRFIGWFIIAGALIAVVVEGAAAQALLHDMLPAFDSSFSEELPVNGAVIVALLGGIVALTFGRIVRVGARMDEDLQGTV